MIYTDMLHNKISKDLNIKCFYGMPDIWLEALSYELDDDCNQKKVALPKQKQSTELFYPI
ncbi:MULTISPECIES: hypothetical protein [unclassified Flavobacterium]|uniref:hypothetical protein n=1 Tax=unclassified Flavobacterium TaxID=196869 RepID=UPI00095C2BFA|nr:MULTISPECIES: hypothetical protein [unclassified Flavobacterium]MBN9284499.1 hypothetical protein [Flavobacterium sp.]OJV72795.1 MAG: hypothetical protein BGO42_15330 [Flavobacterium sp. 40-81]